MCFIFDRNASQSNVANGMFSKMQFMYSRGFHHDVPQFNTKQAVLCTRVQNSALLVIHVQQLACRHKSWWNLWFNVCVVHCLQRVKLVPKYMLGTFVCAQATGIFIHTKNIWYYRCNIFHISLLPSENWISFVIILDQCFCVQDLRWSQLWWWALLSSKM